MKRKNLVLLLCMLVTLSLVGVGFAAWVINGSTNAEAEGNLSATEVVDNRLGADVSFTDDSIVFGATENYDYTGKWLTYEGSIEDLEATLVIIVWKKDTAGNAVLSKTNEGIEITLDNPAPEEGQTASALYTATSGNYIVWNPPVLVDSVATTTTTEGIEGESRPAYKFTYKISFSWGDAFGGQNPVSYYNALNGGVFNDDVADEAKEALQLMYNLNEQKFNVKVVVSPVE